MGAGLEAASPSRSVSRASRSLQLLSLAAGALAISGVGGYWIAASVQCGMSSTPFRPAVCPLSSEPVVEILALLTLGMTLVAVPAVLGGFERVLSVGAAILFVGVFQFPAGGLFPTLLPDAPLFDPRFPQSLFLLVSGFIGFAASAWGRSRSPTGNGPFNRLATGAVMVGLTGWAMFWFPPFLGGPVDSGCPVSFGGALPCTAPASSTLTPVLPEWASATLIAFALVLAVPMVYRALTPVSLGAALSILVTTDYVFWMFGSDDWGAVGAAMFWLAVGASIAIAGLFQSFWTMYVTPRYGSWWSATRVNRT